MMTRVEALRGQLATSLLRLADLQQRAERAASRETVLPRAFDELQRSLSELETAVEELRDQNTRLESARLEAERERIRWEALFEMAPLPYLLTDEKGAIKNVNDAAAAAFAISRRFLVGKPITYFVDGRRAELLSEIANAVNGSEPVTIDFTLRPRERAPHPARVTLRRFTLPDGNAGLWWILDLPSAVASHGNCG
jgi:PAS domain S-box-containing protein